MAAAKTYPDRAIEEAAREAGLNVLCMWQIPGPKDTGIAWFEMLMIGQSIVLVETFKEGGWDVFVTASPTNRKDATVKAVIGRCKRELEALHAKTPAAVLLAREVLAERAVGLGSDPAMEHSSAAMFTSGKWDDTDAMFIATRVAHRALGTE